MEIPEKLRSDGIVEALLEVRFETTALPELIVGQIVSSSPWSAHQAKRLPHADIPLPVRKSEHGLKYQPVMQFDPPRGDGYVIKIGENVLSIHRMGNYPGWEFFQPEISKTLDILYRQVQGFSCERLGFRYVNLLGATHGIGTVRDLDFHIEINKEELMPPLNLNFQRKRGDLHNCIVRVSSPEFVTTSYKDFNALVDIDVFTPLSPVKLSKDESVMWVEEAHEFLKTEFFNLLSDETVTALKE